MQFTIRGEDQYGDGVEITLEAGLHGDSIELQVEMPSACDVAWPILVDALELREALNFADAELAER